MSDKNLDQKPENQQFDFKSDDIKLKNSAKASDFAVVTEKEPGLPVRILRLARKALVAIKKNLKKFIDTIKQVLKSTRGKVTVSVVLAVVLIAGGLAMFFYLSRHGADRKNNHNNDKNIAEILEENNETFLDNAMNLAKKEITEMQSRGENSQALYFAMDTMRKLEDKDYYEEVKEVANMIDLNKLENGDKAILFDYLIRVSYVKGDKDMEERYENLMKELPEEDRIN